MDLQSFIQQYFVSPLAHPNAIAPYNPFNTIVYAIIAIGAVMLLYKAFQRWRIPIDSKFYWAVIPFVLFGSAVRVIVDANVLPRDVAVAGATLYPFVTPGIYLIVAALVLASLAWAKWRSSKGNDFAREFAKPGVVLAILSVGLVISWLQNPLQAGLIVALALLVAWVWSKFDQAKQGSPRSLEKMTLFSQALDGASTFFAIQIGVPGVSYSEQHVIGNAIFGVGGPFLFFLIKVALGIAAVALVRKYVRNENEATYILLLISIMGLAPGARDLLRLSAGV